MLGGGESWIKNKTRELLVYKHSVSTPTFLFMLPTLLHLSLGICSIWLGRCICFFLLQALHVQLSSPCSLGARSQQSHLWSQRCSWLRNVHCSCNSSLLKFCENAEMKCILVQENSWLQQKIKLACWSCWKQQQGHLPALSELWQNHSCTKPSQMLLPIRVSKPHGKIFYINIQITCWNLHQSSPSTRMRMIAITMCHSLREIFLYFLVTIFITDHYLFQGQLSISGV